MKSGAVQKQFASLKKGNVGSVVLILGTKKYQVKVRVWAEYTLPTEKRLPSIFGELGVLAWIKTGWGSSSVASFKRRVFQLCA